MKKINIPKERDVEVREYIKMKQDTETLLLDLLLNWQLTDAEYKKFLELSEEKFDEYMEEFGGENHK